MRNRQQSTALGLLFKRIVLPIRRLVCKYTQAHLIHIRKAALAYQVT